MNRSMTLALIALVVLLILASLTLFTVDQRQNAIVFRLGQPVNVIKKPVDSGQCRISVSQVFCQLRRCFVEQLTTDFILGINMIREINERR